MFVLIQCLLQNKVTENINMVECFLSSMLGHLFYNIYGVSFNATKEIAFQKKVKKDMIHKWFPAIYFITFMEFI